MAEDIQSIGSSSPSSTSLSPCDTNPIASKKRRKRTMISPTELEKLESLFKSEAWPSRVNKVRLAEEIRKTEHFVSTWFQNRRARQKREFKRSKNGSVNFNLPICNLQGDRSVGTVSINGDSPSGMDGTQQTYTTSRIVAANPIVYIRMPVTTSVPVRSSSNSSPVVKKQLSVHDVSLLLKLNIENFKRVQECHTCEIVFGRCA